ncbi:flagellar filament capping protein FliD [Lysinibacillus sp. CNPSo 3705]|uniref:flagellar filament capping protein FliD n=1 Tax=Lysinibacillus sp. CNPSo 3705 TaxID=3028148 RepID=UPI002363CF8C|nr:flagellar filament capping protein FliD [Lysinibacillus sp. CNPSo 3705]MDD1503968.1 flagellar filament capping protein FliD [Lysinibacillus sp. CNPSo 3705]
MVSRIGGLASGMDIDSIVAKLMSAERAPLYKLQQQKTKYEWQRDAYRSVNTKIDTFSKNMFDNFIMSSNFVKKSTTISGANADKVSITAGSGASSSLNIQGVQSLATAATSGAKTAEQTTYRNAVGTDILASIDNNLSVPTQVNFKIDGVNQNINIDSTTTVSGLVQQLKDAGFEKASYDEKTGKFSLGSFEGKKVEVADADSAAFLRDQLGFSTSYTSSEIKIKDPNDGTKEILAKSSTTLGELGINGSSLTFSIGGESPKTVSIDPNKTIGDLVKDLNAEGLDASFDAKTGKLNIKAKDGETLQFDNGSQTDLGKLGVAQTVGASSKAFSQVEIATHGGTSESPTSSTTLQHLGLLNDGKFKISAVQADGKMKDTIIEFKATDTVDSLIKRINSSGAGVTALFSNGQMSISANNTGTNNENVDADIQLKSVKMVNEDQSESIDNSGFELFNKLGFVSSPPSGEATVNLSGKGTNAKYKINDLEMESQSNTINIQGYSVKLNGTFNTDYNPATQGVSVSASNDIDSMMTKIKEFVTTYNGLVNELNGSLKETKYRDYAPLTSEQREKMSESEIKLWEEKARSGLLRNDQILRDGLSKMRMNFTGAIGGLSDSTIDSLSEIGITTSSKVSDGGTLEINETKLRAALEKNPDQVAQIFTQTGKAKDTIIDPVTGQSKTVDSRGIAQRLRDSIDDFKLKIENKAGRSTMTDHQYNIGKSMIDLDTRIERMQKRLVSVEQRYWKQFTAMETAINKANQQSGMFMQGSGGGF